MTKPNKGQDIGAIFLSLKFNGSAFIGLTGFDHYDFTSPWNIQVGFYSGETDIFASPKMPAYGYKNDPENIAWLKSREKEIAKKRADVGSWELRRHAKFGEVPSFLWRNMSYPFEFTTKVKLPK